MKRNALIAGIATLLFGVDAGAAPHTPAPPSARPRLSQGRQKAKKRHRGGGKFVGHLVPASELRTEPLPAPSGHLEFFSINEQRGLAVDLYTEDGSFSESALDELNHFFRCKRTRTEKPIDPRLFETLSRIADHFNGARIELVSGFRNQERETSFHFRGSASDIRLEGVSERELHRYVATLDTGHQGLGIYPRAGFIHVDIRPASFRWVDTTGSTHFADSPPQDGSAFRTVRGLP